MMTSEPFMPGDGRKPPWLHVKLPSGAVYTAVDAVLRHHALHTVCDEARCPNKGECWGAGTATFMIMGDICTRGCRFCAVESASVGCPLRAEEPDEIANAAAELGLAYIVLTSVDRDDLPDRGAGHFAACIRAIRSRLPDSGVEVLVPDYTGLEMATVVAAGPRVVAHNVETVRRLQGVRDARASFDGSLATLGSAKKAGATTKTSILLGLGETESEVLVALDEIRGVGVDILVLGQYLRPTLRHVPITEYVPPAQFDAYATEARSRGFSTVVSAPFARTSYHAREASVGVVAVKE